MFSRDEKFLMTLFGAINFSHIVDFLIELAGGFISAIGSPQFGILADRFGKKNINYLGASMSTKPILLITKLGPSPI